MRKHVPQREWESFFGHCRKVCGPFFVVEGARQALLPGGNSRYNSGPLRQLRAVQPQGNRDAYRCAFSHRDHYRRRGFAGLVYRQRRLPAWCQLVRAPPRQDHPIALASGVA